MKHPILAANVRALRAHLGLKQEVFADRVGSSQPSVSKWERTGDLPETRPLAKMAGLANCSVEDFMDKPWVAPDPSKPSRPVAAVTGYDREIAEITQLDLSFSMGPGTTLDDYIEASRIHFDLDYIRSFTRTNPDRLHLARGVGDSMWPTLAGSDALWLDTTQKVLNQQDRVWAISLYGAAAVKRLRAIGGGKVLVISDNPAVENQEVEAEDLVIGARVIRFERDL